MNQNGNYNPVPTDRPCPTVACQNRLGYVKFNFLSKQFSGDPMSKNQTLDKPAGTLTCVDHHAFLSVFFGNGYNSSIDSPAPTETQKDRNAFVSVVPLDEENTIIVEASQGQETIISLDENSPYYYNRLSAEEIHGACSILEYMINANIKYETIYDIRSAHQENDIKKELIKKTRC